MQADPPADIRVALTWLRMLPLDNAITARCLALTICDPRVVHFYDPHRRGGAAVAASLGAAGKVAWDLYLFYAAGIGWQDGSPPPSAWAHQLKDSSWADPANYCHGKDLVRQLEKALATLQPGAIEKLPNTASRPQKPTD